MNPPGNSGPSINHRIFRAAVIISSAGILVRVVAGAKEFLVAGVFGRSDAMDAFVVAYLLPGFFMNLFSDSGMPDALHR